MSEEEERRRLVVSVFAAETVLGTRTREEQAEVEQRFAGDADYAAEVAAWQRRLAPLAHLAPEAAPSPELWSRIAAETIARLEAPGERLVEAPAAALPVAEPPIDPSVVPPVGGDVVVGLEEAIAARTRLLQGRITRWRWATAAAAALAAGLALFVVGRPGHVSGTAGAHFIGVVSAGGEAPPLVVAVDLTKGVLAVRSLQATPAPGKAFELWAVPPGAKPVSLGLLDQPGTRSIAEVAPTVWRNPDTLLAVSVEPPGGAPGGAPTGPVVYRGKLIRAD